MSHNDTVRQSFKKQAEKFAAYHMSKTEYTDYLIQKVAADRGRTRIRSSGWNLYLREGVGTFCKRHHMSGSDGGNAVRREKTRERKSDR